ncbi:uncharacterized protein Smp_201420 [Schistosoma mansoni]|uniref:uncharacterized protein n=1 Tax=Schistosoma mansoni TaxID=6183 RepID=UPI00022DC331|nr:uncharacterized protein Smp_201420 [Schistosoma mansoni]|eukprot:XP_018649789.1 uncharacterized protein Smp_201420 [Schistosoma mansoni]
MDFHRTTCMCPAVNLNTLFPSYLVNRLTHPIPVLMLTPERETSIIHFKHSISYSLNTWMWIYINMYNRCDVYI